MSRAAPIGSAETASAIASSLLTAARERTTTLLVAEFTDGSVEIEAPVPASRAEGSS